MKQKFNLNIISRLIVVVLVAVSIFNNIHIVQAAAVTSLSDTLTRLKANTAANHEIFFVSPTGIASTQTLILTFGGFTASTVNAILFSDVDFATGSTATCSSATYTEQTLVASGPTTSQWSAAASAGAITVTSGGASATLSANRCVRIRIGTNAVSQTTGVNQITNAASAATDCTVAISGSFGDSGTLDVDVVTDDQVVVTATVNPTITFSVSANSTTFGTLSTSSGRWATGSGANASAGTDPTTANSAHTLAVATNAQSGYVVSYNGATLTSGSNTIPVATISADSDGTLGSSQFAMCGKGTAGAPTVTSGYLCATNASYSFVASTNTTLFSNTTTTSGDTVAMAYLANISGAQAAGSYTTTITYIATGTF